MKIIQKIKFKHPFLFLLFWLFSGFTIGTFFLIFPIRWFLEFTIKHNWSKNTQDYSILFWMLLIVVVSFWGSIILVRFSRKSKTMFWKTMILSIVAFLLSLFLWFNPKLINSSWAKNDSQIYHSDKSEFVFGSYPDEDLMKQLKADTFTAIISLLHPAVVPFEPVLINEEKEDAHELNIDFIHLPMLPWVSDNKTALDSIKKIAKYGKGKYYVHCYLGKDRVNLAKKAILEVSKNAIKNDKTTIRHLWDRTSFERGKIIRIDSGLYVIPYPTDEEFLGYILSSDVKNVVSILSPNNKENIPWIDKEKKIFENQTVKYSLLPLSEKTPSTKLKVIVDSIFSLPRPVVVHPFIVPSIESDIIVSALKKRIIR